jgi:prepilin-type N-terminal cleavage/methylation domain-containing protein
MSDIFKPKNAFTLIEILVVIAIVAILATIVGTSLFGVRDRARDAKRMNDLNQIGRFLTFGCLMPDAGAGEYDLKLLLNEFRTKYPQYASQIPDIKDPKTGTDPVSNYKYIIDASNNCVLYANLEREDEKITLPGINVPTPHGGKGVFEGLSVGWNGSKKFFQISN